MKSTLALSTLKLTLLVFIIIIAWTMLDASISLHYANGGQRAFTAQLYEDGSWELGPVTGCIPFAPCDL